MRNFDSKYLKAAIYGANDGIVTTFAVVSGVMGAQLSTRIVLILGIANMIADGISMAAGDYLGERSEQKLLASRKEKYETKGLWKTGLITFIAFVTAGSLPLVPYVLSFINEDFFFQYQFVLSIIATGLTLFFVGSLRTLFTKDSWLRNGMEMLVIGAAAATLSYFIGSAIERLLIQ